MNEITYNANFMPCNPIFQESKTGKYKINSKNWKWKKIVYNHERTLLNIKNRLNKMVYTAYHMCIGVPTQMGWAKRVQTPQLNLQNIFVYRVFAKKYWPNSAPTH